ncbi:MAG: hypothetical protein Q9217_001477 [Psora testacea]
MRPLKSLDRPLTGLELSDARAVSPGTGRGVGILWRDPEYGTEVVELLGAYTPLFSRPWLCDGFGVRPQRVKLGRGEGIARPANISLVELGLVLYQICSRISLDYGTARASLMTAKTKALQNLHVVENMTGVTLVHNIEACLSTDVPNPSGSDENVEESSLLIRMVATLSRHEHALGGALTFSEADMNSHFKLGEARSLPSEQHIMIHNSAEAQEALSGIPSNSARRAGQVFRRQSKASGKSRFCLS